MSRPTTKTIHELKTIQPFFAHLWTRIKQFEIRYNDRDYKIGDTVILQEYFASEDSYSLRSISATICYITDHNQLDGFVVLGLKFMCNHWGKDINKTFK